MIFGVSFDSVAENKAFAEKFSFPFTLLCDVQRQIGLAYGATDSATGGGAKRISYLIGPDQTIARVYGTVKAAEHPAQVLADLGVT